MVELSEAPLGPIQRGFGGDTLNTALYLARLGAKVGYVTALGADPFSEEMLAAWAEEGIETDLVARVPGALPGLYLIRTDAAGERSFFHWRDSAPVRRLFHLPEIAGISAAMAAAGTLYFSGITLSLFDADSRARLFSLLAEARSHEAMVAFDTNFRPRGWPDRDLARAAYAAAIAASDLVLASVEDHRGLHGTQVPPEAVLAELRAAGVGEAVVKCDTPCCLVWDGDRVTTVAADPVADVVDTTAAGDSFAAAYLAARRTGAAPVEAARAGHRLAGIVIRHRGAIIPRAAMQAQPTETP